MLKNNYIYISFSIILSIFIHFRLIFPNGINEVIFILFLMIIILKNSRPYFSLSINMAIFGILSSIYISILFSDNINYGLEYTLIISYYLFVFY